jgi:hypothetical protein
VSVVCCQRSLIRADHSSRGVLPSVVCLNVIAKTVVVSLYCGCFNLFFNVWMCGCVYVWVL